MGKTGWSLVAMACAMLAAGCETMQSKTAQGAILGSAIGAGTGAIIGEGRGKAGAGTAIGAGIGAVSGGLIGHALEQSEKKAATQQYPSAGTPQAQSQFCPVGGETYGPDVRYCPIHGVELKPKQ